MHLTTLASRRRSRLLLPLLFLLSVSLAVARDDAKPPEHPAHKEAETEAKAPARAEPKEESSVTHHEVTVGGARIPYSATAGNLLIESDEKPVASVFYVAYTRDGVTDLDHRPVTFFYNGGPGSSTIWLHMGSFGPRIVETAEGRPTGPAPYHVVENGDTLLDRSDLVFVDAIGTGFSKPVGKGKGKDFWGVDQDVDAFAKFITRYVTVNHRWNSPKFLFGESYGTPRSAALVYKLESQGMSFNGVVLLSSVLNIERLFSPGLDDPIEDALPTYAAIAWFHDKLPHKPADLGAFLQEVRDYATGEYARALAKGGALPAKEQEAVARKLHDYTGLSVAYLKETNLRILPGRFRKELLRDERRTVGRYDGRFEGIDVDAAGEIPDSDASDTAIRGAFTTALHAYLYSDLKYENDAPYRVMGEGIFKKWDWAHKLPDYLHYPIPYFSAYVVDDLAQAMRENPRLKVLAANGYFDLATPFLGTERDLAHMDLDPSLRGNVTLTYYPSGHMVYLNAASRKAFRADLAKFYDSATQP